MHPSQWLSYPQQEESPLAPVAYTVFPGGRSRTRYFPLTSQGLKEARNLARLLSSSGVFCEVNIESSNERGRSRLQRHCLYFNGSLCS